MKEDLKHKIGLVVVVASLLAVFVMPMVMAAGEEQIACTVTAGMYSVDLTRNVVDYGVMVVNENSSDPDGAINATNIGGVTEDLLIRGTNATTEGGEWALADTIGTDQYRHTFNTGTEHNLTLANQMLVNDLIADGVQEFTLKLYAPSSITTTGDYETTVIVVATPP